MAQVIAAGLAAASSVYQQEADGRRVFRGARPGQAWIGHGTFARHLFTLSSGGVIRLTVHKQRWRLRGTTRTCHSRPPDDLASVWFCSLLVALSMWSWLTSTVGLHRQQPATAALSARRRRAPCSGGCAGHCRMQTRPRRRYDEQ